MADTGGKDKVQVAVRVRPPLPRETVMGKFTSCLGIGPTTDKGETLFVSGDDAPVLLSGDGEEEGQMSRFTFDKVFPRDTSQEEVFSVIMQPTLDRALQGRNATVLAYGQTGSGKTHTMLGGKSKDEEGLVPRTIRTLLEGDKKVSIALSVIQIYQEVATDLLSPEAKVLAVRGGSAGVVVEGLTEQLIRTTMEARRLLLEALDRRVVAGTKLNEVSSRGHLVVRLAIRRAGGAESRLSMVDLAGSERLKDSQAEGKTLKETAAINSSLFALIAVVESLSSGQSFIPYRNSKLTMLLCDSLGGTSFTTVLVAVSPSQQFARETKSSLKFAHNCKRIEHLVIQNTPSPEKTKPRSPSRTLEMPWADTKAVFTRDLVTTSQFKVACYYAGPLDGPPLVLLHACPSSSIEFAHLLPGLVYAGFRVISFDQPGYGGSPGPRANSRSEKAADPGGPVDVLKSVLEHHQVDSPVLLGYDWGAGIALTFGILYPKRVSKIISFLPSFSETPQTMLESLKIPTMVLWVRQDTNHSWKRFQSLAKKIPKVRIEFVKAPDPRVNYHGNCYEKLSDEMMTPILNFLRGEVVGGTQVQAVKGRQLASESTIGEDVVEICNVNFETDLNHEEIEEIMTCENPQATAVRTFKKLAAEYGYETFYNAEENHSHELHQSVSSVLRALPVLSPQRLEENPSLLVELGLWPRMPTSWSEMMSSPRYFPGREVLVKVNCESNGGNGITKVATIEKVNKGKVQVRMGEDLVEVSHEEIALLNQPHNFYFEESTGKLRLEDGLHCDYKAKLAKGKLVEICLSLAPLVEKLDFTEKGRCEELQKEMIRTVRSCLNMVTFQRGVDRTRISRTDNAGKLAVNGQGHCHGVSSTMAAFLLPFTTVLGIDLKYRGCYTFHDGLSGPNNAVERHQCLEVSLRPSGKSFLVDLWMAEKFNKQEWLALDIQTAYSEHMYPNGALILNTTAKRIQSTDFDQI